MPLILVILGVLYLFSSQKKTTSAIPSLAQTAGDAVKNYVSQVEQNLGVPTTTTQTPVIPVQDSLPQSANNPIVVPVSGVLQPAAGSDPNFNQNAGAIQGVITKIPIVGQLLQGVKAIGNLFDSGNYDSAGVDEARARAMYGTNPVDGSIWYPTAQDIATTKTEAADQYLGIDTSKPIISLSGIATGGYASVISNPAPPAPPPAPAPVAPVAPAPVNAGFTYTESPYSGDFSQDV